MAAHPAMERPLWSGSADLDSYYSKRWAQLSSEIQLMASSTPNSARHPLDASSMRDRMMLLQADVERAAMESLRSNADSDRLSAGPLLNRRQVVPRIESGSVAPLRLESGRRGRLEELARQPLGHAPPRVGRVPLMRDAGFGTSPAATPVSDDRLRRSASPTQDAALALLALPMSRSASGVSIADDACSDVAHVTTPTQAAALAPRNFKGDASARPYMPLSSVPSALRLSGVRMARDISGLSSLAGSDIDRLPGLPMSRSVSLLAPATESVLSPR